MQFGQAQPDKNRRLIGIGGVVVFHALLVWGLVSGLARKAIEILPAPIETKIIEEIRPPEETPPPPPPTLEIPPPPFVPPPEISIATPPPKTAITVQSKVAAPPKAEPKKPPMVALRVDGRRCRPPEYPSVSQRLGEQGSVVLQLLVGTDGRVQDAKVAKSSGFPRLDEAARKGLSLCKFDPPSTASWGTIKYTFRPAN